MGRRRKARSVRDNKISWPLESHRNDPSGENKPTILRRIPVSWPIESTTEDVEISPEEREAMSEKSPAGSAYDHPSSSKRSTSPSSTPRAMSLGSILRDRKPSASCSTYEWVPPFEYESPHKLPSAKAWELAADVELLDSRGNSRTFRSIYSGPAALGDQQLIIFVRHFFCSACQAYLKALSSSLSLKKYLALPVPTSITIIGLGSPGLLQKYRQSTGIPFALFTDPTRKLYKLLGMSWSLNMGPRPNYFNDVNEAKWIWNQCVEMKKERSDLRFRGGGWWWVGGEFLVREGRVVWCHRMENYRDHAEVEVLKKLVGAEQ